MFKKGYIVTFILAFALGSFVTYYPDSKTSNPSVKGVETTAQASPTPIPCVEETVYDDMPGLDYSTKKLENNQTAINIIRERCLTVWDVYKSHLDSSGNENFIFTASAQGCGSCHGVNVFILSGDKIIFDEGMDDPIFELAKTDEGKQGFTIIQPLRKRLEGLCCPTNGVKTFYEWSEPTKSFWGYDEIPYEYEQT